MNKKNASSALRFWGIPVDLILVIASIVTVAVATLYPFNFSVPEYFSLLSIFERFDNTSFFKDQISNILLFMPLGCGITSILLRKNVPLLIQILVVIITGACLSFTVEFLQSFLPSRDPTPADIINNTIGCFVGLLSFYILDTGRFRSALDYIQNSQVSNRRSIKVFLTGYILITFLIGISWKNNINLQEWNSNFPLLIGNELTGDRPWQGSVSQISIADKAFSDGEIKQIFSNPNYLNNNNDTLLAAYKFDGKDNYRDITGKQPDLLWQGQASKNQSSNQKEVSINSSRWLKTLEPVKLINQRISQTSQFTIITTVASANPNQKGPARIISVSGDAMHRNFTLGQDKTDLALRLRTPLTGQNGSDIRLSVPNVFADTKSHSIIVSYAKGKMRVYVDQAENFYSFNLLELYPNDQKVFAYAITFIPLGLYLTVLSIMARKFTRNQILLISGIFLPSLIVESILIHVSDKSFSFLNLGLGIFFTACTALLFKARIVLSSAE
jgi:VanZ family protein